MIDQYDGIAVGRQIVHDACKPCNVGRVQAYGRFIQHVEDACGAVADGTGKLHSLPFAGGKGGGRPVYGKVAKP